MNLTLWFVDQYGRPVRVCQRKHRRGTGCAKTHAVPLTAIWSGSVDPGLRGELIVAAREARRKHRLALRRWTYRKGRLAKKKSVTAPAFLAYIKAVIDQHEAAKPVLTFSIDAERVGAS